MTTKLYLDPAADLNLILWGDPQIARIHPDREENLAAACETVAAADGRADALILLGDVAEYGAASEYATVQRHLAVAARNTDRIFCVSGNHDIRARSFRRQCARFSDFLAGVPNGVPNPPGCYWFPAVIKNYRFLFMGADKTCFEGTYLSPAQLSWLAEELDAAKEEGKPAFVFNHQPLLHTNGLPATWGGSGSWRGSVGDQNDALRSVFKRHGGEIVYVTGHLHAGISRCSVEHSGRLHMINVPTVGCPNHPENDAPAQGFVLRVYQNRIEGRGILFRTGEEMDESIPNARFSIPLPCESK